MAPSSMTHPSRKSAKAALSPWITTAICWYAKATTATSGGFSSEESRPLTDRSRLTLSLALRQLQGSFQRRFRGRMVGLPSECFLELLCRLGVTLLPRQGDSVVKSGINEVRLQAHHFSKLRSEERREG